MSQPTQGPVLKERVWRFIEALLTRAEDSPNFDVGWETDKNTGRPNFVVKTKRRFLESLAQLKKQELTDVIKSLENLRIWDDRRLRRGKGSEIGSFALKLWSTDAQRNWEQFDRIWEDSRPDKSKDLEETFKNSSDSGEALQDEIDWRDVCHAMLEKQKRLTTNELLSADEDMKFELDDIHVPLALVQRTKPDKRSGDVSPEQGSRLLQPTYEEKQRFKHEEFLAQVLQEGKGQSKGRRIAVIGEPGAGKTTLLQSIAFWILDKNLGLPIWISLADLQGKTVEEYLLHRWLKNALEVARVTPEQENVLLELFKNNRVWLFLDGVDEIAGGSVGVGAQGIAPLQVVASQLEGWVAKARVVLSCRLNVWEANINALGDEFETYRLLDFDYPLQVKKFICRWFRKSDADKGERLWTELDKSERQRIQDLVKNPLRLALLCSTWQSSDKGLPSTKAGLYQRFVEVFYTWKKNRFRTTFEQRQELNAALGRLALRAIDSEVSRFRLRHKVVCEVLGDPEREGSLFGLALQLGWLNKVGLAAESETQEKVYAFYHPTFQEYFAALAIDDWNYFLPRAHGNRNPKPVSEKYRIFEPQWKEVILLWLGREDVAREQFIQALVEFEDGCRGFYGFRAFFLAAVGIAEFRNCFRADEIVAQIVQWGFGYFNTEKQERQTFPDPLAEGARATLSQTDRSRAINQLVDLLETTKDKDTRRSAAYSLGKIDPGNPQAIEALVRILETTKDKDTRRSAPDSLGKIDLGNPQAIEALVRILATTEDEATRWSAPDSLGEIGTGNPQAIEALVRILATTEDLLTRLRTEESLAEIGTGNQQAIEALVRILETTKDEDIRWRAAYTLREIGTGNQQAIEALVRILATTKDEDTRRNAAYSLAEIGTGNQQAIEALVRILATTKNENTRWRVAYSLGKIGTGNQQAIEALVRILATTKDEDTRRNAAYSLAEIGTGNQQAIEALVRILATTKDENTRWNAAYSLGKIDPGNQQAIEALVRILATTKDENTRWNAACSLGRIDPGNQQAIEALVRILETTEDEIPVGVPHIVWGKLTQATNRQLRR
jgi:HEAT repeat protein